jgi:phosphatidylserine decarboxylase
MKNNLFPIAQSGIKYVSVSAAIFVLCFLLDLDLFTLIAFLVTFALGFAFRNPERELPAFEQGSVVSPVDGVVTSIESIEDENFAYKVKIDTTCLDVGVLRVPMASKLQSTQHYHGSRLSNEIHLHQEINENAILLFEDSNKNLVKIHHRLKQSFAPIFIDIIEAQELRQGTRYGVQINGTTTIFLPKNFRVNVSVGNQLQGSQSLLGYLS